MSAPSVVDHILTSISHLTTSAPPSSTPPPTISSSTRYNTDQQSPSKPSNPLTSLPPTTSKDARSLFLALHFLFPHELLPALDLLDRGLVTRLVPSSLPNTRTNSTSDNDVFYIQSASAATSQHHPKHSTTTPGEAQGRFRNALASNSTSKSKGSATQTYYEVRLDSWNCSCAAFAFSSFTSLTKTGEDVDNDNSTHQSEHKDGDGHGDGCGAVKASSSPLACQFGGVATVPNAAAGVPVCKHILAAMMARASPDLFLEGVHVNVRREVGREEMAGWGSGWGDGTR